MLNIPSYSPKILGNPSGFPAAFGESDENSDGAICTPELCDVALGFFSTPEKAEAAVAQRSKEPGLRDYPGQFLIVKRELPSAASKAAEELYEAVIYAHTADLEYEYRHRIGFFTDLASANEAVEWAKRRSQGAIPGVETEYIAWKPVLDLPNWDGGFERY